MPRFDMDNNKRSNLERYEEISADYEYEEEIEYDSSLYRWSAPEHDFYTVGRNFYLFSAIFLAGIVIYALITNSPIMAITFILIGVVGYLFLQKEPTIVNFSITPNGILAGHEIYEFDSLKSFWIFYDPPYEKKLSIKSKSTFTPFIHFPLGNENPVEIRNILIKFIPEEKQDHTLVDAAERFLYR